MKTLFAALVALLWATGAAFGQTYSSEIGVNFGQTYSGLSSSVYYAVVDSGGTTRIIKTNSGVSEITDDAGNATTGSYRVAVTLNTTWSYPLSVRWTINGKNGVAVLGQVGADRAALLTDGYSSTNASRISNLPNVAAGSSGGLPTVDAANKIAGVQGVTFPSTVPSQSQITGGAYPLNTDSGGGVKVSTGTGAGQINLSSGKVPATLATSDVTGTLSVNTTQLAGQTVSAAAGVTFPSTVSSLTQTQVTGGAYAINTDGSGNVKISSGTGANQLSLSMGKVAATVASGDFSDKAGFSLTTAEHTAIAGDVLGATASSYNSAGTIGQKINSAGSASDPMASAMSGYTTSGTFGNFFRLFAPGVDSSGRVTVGAYGSGLDPAASVLNATASSYNTSGTIGNKINAAGGAADPLTNALSSYTTGGTVGNMFRLFNGAMDSSGRVTIGAYGTGLDPAASVLNATASSYNTSGTIGNKINSGGGAVGSDPLVNTLSSYTTAGTVGNFFRLFSAGVDSSGRVILQPITHTGAVIPTVTTLSSTPTNFNLLSINSSGQVQLDLSQTFTLGTGLNLGGALSASYSAFLPAAVNGTPGTSGSQYLIKKTDGTTLKPFDLSTANARN